MDMSEQKAKKQRRIHPVTLIILVGVSVAAVDFFVPVPKVVKMIVVGAAILAALIYFCSGRKQKESAK